MTARLLPIPWLVQNFVEPSLLDCFCVGDMFVSGAWDAVDLVLESFTVEVLPLWDVSSLSFGEAMGLIIVEVG